MRQLCKGNVAVVKGAILAGCRGFYGYPITPASEIAESAALYLPQVGGTFLQAESEVAAINMVYGAAATGMRVMTASSGPGISLMQEGISYLAGAELPCVIVDVVRAGPGLGNIAPEQSDYFAMVKGGGHGNYRNIVLAPASVQEMAELTMLAFDLADKYRNPAVVLADGFVGQMMEPLHVECSEILPPEKLWAVKGTPETRANLISSIYLEPDLLEAHQRKLEAKYVRAQQLESRYELYHTEDAEVLLVGFGIVSRVLLSAVDTLRREGVKAGAFRAITLWPYPAKALAKAARNAQRVLVFELSNGQMVEDVRLALHDSVPVEFYGRVGGNVPSVAEVRQKVFGSTSSHIGPVALVRAGELRSPLVAQYATGRVRAPAATPESRKERGTEQKQVDLFAMVS
jgi:2-oxoisovalerate ferredoxin oxidoreductase alpha subunit